MPVKVAISDLEFFLDSLHVIEKKKIKKIRE
jgi:hypothetical protein